MTPTSTGALSGDHDEPEIGELSSAYTLLGELGRGGNAIVYRAVDRSLLREVAIKVVRPRFSESGQEALARLAREARTVARLQHPNIVTVYAVRQLADGGLALVMQLIAGRTLKQALVDDGPFTPERAERVVKDIAEALAHAHAQGVVHRDVKPENIFLDSITGRALLSDFGIAHSTEFDSRLTMDGAAIGTPAYMAPEQIDGSPANARSDLYSLGLVAWEMLTGDHPWEGEALYSVIFKQKNEDLPSIDALRPGVVPQRLQYIVERMMQKRPSARWAGADGLLAALNNWVIPGDWKQWEASHRRRRATLAAKPQLKSLATTAAGAATVRFVRPADALATASASPLALPNGAIPATAPLAPTEDDAPSWASEPPARPRLRSWLVFGGLAVLIGGASLGGWARRAGMLRSPNPTVGALNDSRAVEMPIVSRSDGRGGAELVGADPGAIDPSKSAQRIADSIRVDSMFAAAMRRAEFAGASRPGTQRIPAPTSPTAVPSGSIASSAAPGPTRVAAVRATDDPGVIAAGGRHSCALSSGRAFCWGANERGQLGDGDVESRDTPVLIIEDLGLVQISSGLAHTCGVQKDGDAYCWGSDDRGQLGDATTTSRSTPVRVASGQAFQLLRAGHSHTCGLTVSGEVTCWGANANGQVGDGSTAPRAAPVAIGGTARFVSLTAGWNHSCAIAVDGSAWCWGANANGQLGSGARTDAAEPSKVVGGLVFTSISAGGAHTCAITESGETYCWGRNNYGQLGAGAQTDQAVPTRVDTPLRFASVTAGGSHACARTRAGQTWCWGRNIYGQLGDGTLVNRDSPTRVSSSSAFVSVNATESHTCGTTVDGESYCWGFNADGQLGDGTRSPSARPTAVNLPMR